MFRSLWAQGNDSVDLGFQYWHRSTFAGVEMEIREFNWFSYAVNHYHTFQCCYLWVSSSDILGFHGGLQRNKVLRSYALWTGSMDRLTLKMKALWAFETSEAIYQSIRRNTLWRTFISRSTLPLFFFLVDATILALISHLFNAVFLKHLCKYQTRLKDI